MMIYLNPTTKNISYVENIILLPNAIQAIPDTKLTIKKYADVKFEYLSYCLKVSHKGHKELISLY